MGEPLVLGQCVAGHARPLRVAMGPAASPNGPRLADKTIEAGIALAGTIPEMVEWYGNPSHRVTIRVEVHIGRYAEGSLCPHFAAEDVADVLRSLSRSLTP